MALQPVHGWIDADKRVHLVRNTEGQVIGVAMTFSPDEMGALMTRLHGMGTLNGAWFVLETARLRLQENVRMDEDLPF